MTRPPARDQPSESETADLARTLVAIVTERQRLNAARAVRGPDAQLLHWRVDGEQAWLAHTRRGALVAEATVPAEQVLAVIEGGGGFDGLLTLLDS